MIAYFDLENLFVNELVGNYWIFILLAFIGIWLLCIKAKMPYQIPTMLSIILAGIGYGMQTGKGIILWVIAVMVAGTLFYLAIAKMWNR